MPKLDAFTTKKKQTPPEYDAWKAEPSDDNFNNLLKYINPVINNSLTTYAGGNKNLRTRANILATQAITNYDPDKGTSLNTWVFQHMQRLRRYQAQRGSVVHIPENVRLDRTRIKRFQTEYMDKHGIDPDDITIGDALQMSAKKVSKALREGEVSESSRLSEKGDTTGQSATQKTHDQIWLDYVHHDLDPTNRKVLEWTTGYNGTTIIPKQEIAKRLGISSPAVSLRVNRIMGKLQEGM